MNDRVAFLAVSTILKSIYMRYPQILYPLFPPFGCQKFYFAFIQVIIRWSIYQ
jgi:hypothetical protein